MSDVEKSTEELVESPRPAKWFGLRYIQFLMLFVCILISYGIRTNMSVGILAMMDEKPANPNIETYPDWQNKQTIISSFFWGYVVPQIGAGAIVKKFGSKWFLLVTMFFNSLFTILIPVMASSLGEGGVIACRVIEGFNQGFLYPSTHTLLGAWTPTPERSTVGSFVYTAGPLGTVVSLIVTGVISDSQAGWPAVFYLFGGLGIAWCVLWSYVGANTPEQHGRVSKEELHYINYDKSLDEPKKLPIPWKSMATSMPFIAILVAHAGQNWGFWTLLTEIPTYLSNIMKYDMTNNSLLSALPYFVLWILNFVFSPIADALIMKNLMSRTNVRKMFHTIGVVIPAIALIALSFVDSSQRNLAIVLLVIAVGTNAGTYSGFNVNHIDLSPNHAGILMGTTNSLSNVLSIIAPLAINVIPYEDDDPMLWRYAFCISSGIYIVSDIFYLIFASGDIQPWNDLSEETKSSKEDKQSYPEDIPN